MRYARKPRGVTIPLSSTIQKRPAHIGERSTFGHWEGDLLAFRKEFGKSNLTTLVERQSRYTVLIRNPDRNSTGVMTGVIQQLRSLPSPARRASTFDPRPPGAPRREGSPRAGPCPPRLGGRSPSTAERSSRATPSSGVSLASRATSAA